VGRFLSIDPLVADYPWNSPYAFAENKVIQFVELEGLETGQGPSTAPTKPTDSPPQSPAEVRMERALPGAKRALVAFDNMAQGTVTVGGAIGVRGEVKAGPTQVGGEVLLGGARATAHFGTTESGTIEPQKVEGSYGVLQLNGNVKLPGVAKATGSTALVAGTATYDGKLTGQPVLLLPTAAKVSPNMPSVSREGVIAGSTLANDGAVGATVGVGFLEVGFEVRLDKFATWLGETMNTLGALFSPVIPDPAQERNR